MPSRRALRAAFLSVVLLSAAALAAGYVGYATADVGDGDGSGAVARAGTPAANGSGANGSSAVARADEVTVVTTQVFRGWVSEGKLVAFGPDGERLYYDDSYGTYHDVDPSPKGTHTVTYLGVEFHNASECERDGACATNVIRRTNLSTGESEVLYSTVLPKWHKWHDVDRVNETHVLVADIVNDRAFVLNVETGERGWTWNASEAFSREAGGPPDDWTHLNDVELLPDGRVMLSPRNMDQVVFVEPGEGVQENWTLGAEDEFDTLYEQHNPDYIPESEGGPAVVVADSENNRIVEYQRVNGSWERTWVWSDARLQWPRDADRLPNGNTLVTDSNGNRVLEVAPNGSVVWSARVGLPYEAERLGTGDESAGGPAMAELVRQGVVDDGDPDDGEVGTVVSRPDGLWSAVAFGIKEVVPAHLLSSALFVLPPWVGVLDLIPAAGLSAGLLGWATAEAWWRLQPVGRARRRLSG